MHRVVSFMCEVSSSRGDHLGNSIVWWSDVVSSDDVVWMFVFFDLLILRVVLMYCDGTRRAIQSMRGGHGEIVCARLFVSERKGGCCTRVGRGMKGKHEESIRKIHTFVPRTN